MGRGHAQPGGALQPVAVRIDAHQGNHLQLIGQAQDFDHQIGTDVARSDDGDLEFVRGSRHGTFDISNALWSWHDINSKYAVTATLT